MPEGSRIATKFDTINYTYMNSIVLEKRATTMSFLSKSSYIRQNLHWY